MMPVAIAVGGDMPDMLGAVLEALIAGGRLPAAVALLQISIALGAIAALTVSRLVWFGSLGLGAVGAILLVIPMVRGI